jgi:hypothetical protein
MAKGTIFSILFALPSYLDLAYAMPLPGGSSSTAFNAPLTLPGAPALKGGPELLGYSPNNKLSTENTHVPNIQLAPGQTADADLGEYLDFENNNAPQPIRGTKGGTDPGPSKF